MKLSLIPATAAVALLAVLSASAAEASWNPCKPNCTPGKNWNRYTCPWKYCTHKRCTKGWGWECTRRQPKKPTPSPSPKAEGPPTTCRNKCFVKWIDARDTCNMKICKIKGCPTWVDGRKKWGFRCVAKMAPPPMPSASPSPSPSASPSPEPAYPPYCPLRCRRWKGAVEALCDPSKCVVARCRNYNPKQWWKRGFNCVPIAPTPSASPSASVSATPSSTPSATPSATPSVTPSSTPSASPSVSPTPSPMVKPSCESRCRRGRWRVVNNCDKKYCMVRGCKNPDPYKWWKYGYECVPKEMMPTPSASPSASPSPKPSCGNMCLWRKRRKEVVKMCDPEHCVIERCWPWKALKCVDKY